MNLNEIFENYRQNPCESRLIEVLKESQLLIYGVVAKITNHQQDAEDLTQEVLIKVIQNINLIPTKTNFVGWLNRVSLNVAINHYHQKKHIKTQLSAYQDSAKNLNTEADETIIIIYQHLSKLDDLEESLVLNKYIHHMTFAQLSNLYKLPISTIETKIQTILKKLKSSLEKTGFAGVALALASTLDQLKATEISFDLLPKIKDHFPATYPKAKSELLSKKVILKVLVPLVAVLIAYFTIDYLNSSSQEIEKPSSELAKVEKPVKTIDGIKNEIETNNKNQANSQNENTDSEPSVEVKETIKNADLLAIAKEEPKALPEKDFAGQLIDAETKKPIADAKLEIWDIYTYEKIETTTDAEGKYFVPKDLDSTFFFFLKFIKEGYAAKATFQHFEIHSNILVYMNKGKRITSLVNFYEKPFEGQLYLKLNCNLNKEQYLSGCQKQALKQVYSYLMSKAPIDLYTFKTIKIENVDDYIINDFFELSEDGSKCGLFVEMGSSMKHYWSNIYDNENSPIGDSNSKLVLAETGKLVSNKVINGFNYKKNEKFNIKTDASGKVENTNRSFLVGCALTFAEKNHYSSLFPLKGHNYDFNFDFRTLYVFPYTSIIFEPLSLNLEYHNSQIIFRGDIFSKKSIFKQSPVNEGKLNVYNKFFEKMLIINDINVPIGGVIDVNAEINSYSERPTKLEILVNGKQLKDIAIQIYMKNEKQLIYGEPEEAQIDKTGIALINLPFKTKKIMIQFSVNQATYSKEIDLVQLSNDKILLNFNKKLEIQVNQEVIKSKLKANSIQKTNRLNISDSEFEKRFSELSFNNINSSIKVPISETFVFLEKDTEYDLVNSGGGIKTLYNELTAINLSIKTNIETLEIKPVTDLDYTNFHVDIIDENGAEIKDLTWFIEWDYGEINAEHKAMIRSNEYKTSKHLPLEFIKKSEGDEIGNETERSLAIFIGAEAIRNKKLCLLKNRKYFLYVFAEGYINYLESFNTKESSYIGKKVVLRKSNSVAFKSGNENELFEITQLIKSFDIIFEYNGIRLNNKDDFVKAQKTCKNEKVTIKLIRNNMLMSLMIPAYQIHGLEDHYYDDKDGILTH